MARSDRQLWQPGDVVPTSHAQPDGPVLWLLRHGQAAHPAGMADAQRPLTLRGEQQARQAGERLREWAPELAVAACSPRVRAMRTAELATQAHGAAPTPVVIDELGDDYSLAELLALLAPWREEASGGHLLVVGHNPTLAWIAHQLAGEQRGLSTGTLIGIDLAARAVHAYLPGS